MNPHEFKKEVDETIKLAYEKGKRETLQAVVDLIEHRTTECTCCNDFEKRLKSLDI